MVDCDGVHLLACVPWTMPMAVLQNTDEVFLRQVRIDIEVC